MRKVLGFIIGAIVGGLVGATLALLYAPESGAELRARIRERAETFATEVRQAAATKRIELQERLDSLRAPKAG
ncbi:MAG: YtxH domain-containing protein [Anaerolineales bacterium]